jgi:hypothetical protein
VKAIRGILEVVMGVDDNIVPIAAMLVPIVGSIALFSFLGVASWCWQPDRTVARRKTEESPNSAEQCAG